MTPEQLRRIERLNLYRREGVLTEVEYVRLKATILGRTTAGGRSQFYRTDRRILLYVIAALIVLGTLAKAVYSTKEAAENKKGSVIIKFER
jgi:hypothetical protein